jgi:hypothetical protein
MSFNLALDRAAQGLCAARGDDDGIQALANLDTGAADVGVEAYREEGVNCFAAPSLLPPCSGLGAQPDSTVGWIFWLILPPRGVLPSSARN